MSQTRRGRVALLIYGTLLVCLTGCATGRRAQRDLQQLAATLPGIYETLPQPEQPALQLAITPLLVPVIGEHVFHVRESIAGDERRIVSQSIWMLTLDAQGNIAQTVWRFSQPERWRTGDQELFRSLLPQDLQPLPGCMLQWTRTAPGYNAQNVATPAAAAEGSSNPIPARLQLNGDRLSASVQRCGEAATPATGEVWYQFQRRRS